MEKIVIGCIDCPFKYEYDMAVGYGCKIDTSNRTIKQSKKYQPIDPEKYKADWILGLTIKL